MRKFLNKILVFLCAALCLLIGAGCWGEGGGLGGKTAEQKGRARFAEIPVAVYVDGETHENGWKLNQNERLFDGCTIEIKADGTIVVNENQNVRLGKYVEEMSSVYIFEVEGSITWEEIWVYKTEKRLEIKE